MPPLLPSDAELARLCLALYNDPGFAWDDLIEPEAAHGICLGIKVVRGYRVLVFRGSETIQDWWRDGISELWRELPAPFSALGDVALGFSADMPELWAKLAPGELSAPWCVTGHSLGAARATLFAGMGVATGNPPLKCSAFGVPRVGMRAFCRAMSGVPGQIYKNASQSELLDQDPVCDVPTEPPFGHHRAWTLVDIPAPPGDAWGLLRRHHMELYAQGVQAA